jgi:hypothetical protein
VKKVSIRTVEIAIGLARSVAYGTTKFPFLGYCADLMERMKNELEEARKTMPYVNKPRPYDKEYDQQKSRGEHERRMERQRARRALDKKMPDGNGNGKADAREGKDVAHRKAMDKGGSNKDGTYITTAAKNRSFKRDSKGNLVSETSKKEKKKK